MFIPFGISSIVDPPISDLPPVIDYTVLLSLILLALSILIGCALGYMLFRRFL